MKCIVLAQKDHPSWKEEDEYRGIPIQRFNFNAILETRDVKKIGPIKEYLDWAANVFQPDIVYLNTLFWGSAFVFLLFRRLFQIPVILTIHAPYFEEGIPPLMEQICREADWICCGSKWGSSVMEKRLPSMRERFKTIYYGISWPKEEPAPPPFSPPTLLLLGRLSVEKGFDVAIEAFSLLKKSGSPALLLIVGDGPYRPALETLVAELNLTPFVRFAGAVLNADIPLFLNRASFVVIPSHFEAFGLVAVESMQMGRAVIASNVGGLPEIVSDPERGVLVPPRNPVALYRAMASFLDQPQEIVNRGVRAREWIRERFTLTENLDQYEALFEEAILCSR